MSTKPGGEETIDSYGEEKDSVTALEQELPLLALPAEIRTRIYEYALPARSLIMLRAEGLVASRYGMSGSKYAAGPPIRITPAQPSLTKTCKQLQKETYLYYYTSNTFFFSDTMLHPGVLSALKTNQPGISMMRQMKIYHSMRNTHIGSHNYESFTRRFSARLDKRNDVEVENLCGLGGQKSPAWQPGMKEGVCGCFIEQMALEGPTKANNKDGVLLQLLERYVAEMDKVDEVASEVCEWCDRFKALSSAD